MKGNLVLSVNRKGSFFIDESQCTESQCGYNTRRMYEWNVCIEATDKQLTIERFVIDNNELSKYFNEKYHVEKCKVISCEDVACEAVEYFKNIFKEKYPFIDLKRIKITISGAGESFITAEWKNNA